MKKRFLSILLAVLTVLSAVTILPITAFAEAQPIGSSNVTWALSNNNTVLTLGGTGAMPDFTWLDMSTVDTPWYSAKDTITTVKLGSGITRIGQDAFSGCKNIVNLYIEDLESWCKIEIPSATSYPFRGEDQNNNLYVNGNLTTDLVIPDTITKIKNYTFTRFTYLTSVTIPSSVTSIGVQAFAGCADLTSVTIPSSVTNIGDTAFTLCESLTSVTIPSSVTSIGNRAFAGCADLTNVTISSGVTSIGENAFVNSSKLTSVTIPSSVTSIGSGVFAASDPSSDYDGCVSLTTVTVKATTPPALGSSAFPTSNAGFKVYVPYGTLTDYQNAARWKLPTLKPCLAEAYVVDDKPTTNGTVAMSKDCFPVDTYTEANENVTVTVTPAKGYALKSLSYYTTDPASATDITATKSFTMPKANVTVTAAFELAAPGTEANPWEIGTTGHKSDVTAYVKNNTLYVDGDGVINGFGGLEGFNASEIYDIVVKSAAVTGAEANAFADFGDGFGLTLPDGWLGELPDERGKWYGADQVSLTAFPNVVKNVTVVQKYPWNGNVEITAEAMGFDERTVSVLVYKKADGVWQQISSPSVMGDAGVVDLEDGKSLTLAFAWNSATDLGPDTLSEVYLEIKLDEITSVKTEAFDVDSRTEISLPEGETTVRNVWWSDTAWGAMQKQSVTIGWQNKTTGESGTLATDLFGTDVTNVSLPAKDGVYALTHSVAGLTSFANYVVTGYPTHAVTDGTTDENGSISFSTVAGVEGETVTVTVTPDEGYRLKSLNCVPKPSAWSVIGDFGGDAWTKDVPMVETESGVFVSPVLTLSEGNQFKVRKNADWTVNYGGPNPYAQDPYTATIGNAITAASEGENISVPSAGTYIVTLNLNDSTITLTSASTSVADPVAITVDANGKYTFTMPAYDVTVTAEFEAAPTPEYKYTEYANWQIKYGNTWEWSDDMDKVEDGLFKIEIWWEGTGINVKSDENPIKEDWFAPEELTLGEEVIAPVIVDVYLRIIDDETLMIGIGVDPAPAHSHAGVKQNGQPATETAAGWEDYYECDCGIYFEDEECTIDIGDDTALATWKTGDGAIAKLVHTITPVSGQAATQTEAGFKAYYECKNCGKYYEDADGKTEIADLAAWKAQGGNGYLPSGNEITAAKTAAKAALDTENAKDPLADGTALTNGKSAIDSAETLADIENAKNTAIAAIQNAQKTELDKAIADAQKALTAQNEKDPLTDTSIFDTEYGKLSGAATKAELKALSDDALVIVSTKQEIELKNAKDAAKEALEAENAKSLLTDRTALTNGLAAIDAAKTKTEAVEAKDSSLTAIREAQNSSDSPVTVTIEGGDTTDVVLKVEVVVEADELVAKDHKAIVEYKGLAKKNEVVAGVYDVRLVLNGETVQPDDLGSGTVVTIRMKIPETLIGKEFRLVHVHASDDVTTVVPGDEAGIGTYVVDEDGYLITKLDKLSEFVFLRQEGSSGSLLWLWILLGVIGLLAIAAVVYFCFLRKRPAKGPEPVKAEKPVAPVLTPEEKAARAEEKAKAEEAAWIAEAQKKLDESPMEETEDENGTEVIGVLFQKRAWKIYWFRYDGTDFAKGEIASYTADDGKQYKVMVAIPKIRKDMSAHPAELKTLQKKQ